MNWEAIQAGAELVAAMGVVVSLVYLARQVRDNTSSVRTAANQDLMTSFNAVMAFPSASEHGARLYRTAVSGSWEELTTDEVAASRIVMVQITRVFEQAYLQYRAGFLEEDVWAGWRYQMVLSLGLPGYADAWRANRPMVNPDFARMLDGLREEAPHAVQEYASAWATAGVGVHGLEDSEPDAS